VGQKIDFKTKIGFLFQKKTRFIQFRINQPANTACDQSVIATQLFDLGRGGGVNKKCFFFLFFFFFLTGGRGFGKMCVLPPQRQS
jgi:hypothetical protein